MKWDMNEANGDDKGHHLGRGCMRCSGSAAGCKCTSGGDGSQCTGTECQCAKEGKCCKCCCTGCNGKCKEECKKKGCSCDGYTSAYQNKHESWIEGKVAATWTELKNDPPGIYHSRSITVKRHQCAQILLGSVCLIWSGITYMYWTGKYPKNGSSPYWNNHILDGSGLDDGTLSQWLQALGFPREMLNDSGPGNRLDAIIWDGLRDMLFLGFLEPSGLDSGVVSDYNGNTARSPYGMNYPGFIHTAHRDSFNTDQADVFPNGTSSSSNDTNQDKRGAIFKLYILSCAYFTGLQKKTSGSTTQNTTPKTIREILYWLSALPYSPAYKDMLGHAKEKLKSVAPKNDESTETLSFIQTGLKHPITVDIFNLFAHFQAVTQYCPLVLIGIQGGLHSTTKTTPAIHALYANTECYFTYPTVPIQAYNQVVHYIRGLFYQLYFLRKQCAVKVAMGGKWRECRYGSGVIGKDVVSWMCLGCNPMEHDRKCRVGKVKEGLDGVKGKPDSLAAKVMTLLEKIGEVVVQLGNAQEALEGKAESKAIDGVKQKLGEAKEKLKSEVNGLNGKLQEAKTSLEALTNDRGDKGSIDAVTGGSGVQKAKNGEYDPGKNKITDAIHTVHKVLKILKNAIPNVEDLRDQILIDVLKIFEVAITDLQDICTSPKCPGCKKHSDKCGKQSTLTQCPQCLQPTTTGVPSPLQAFLEDRLPGFSCEVVRSDGKDQPDYPPAASHLYHSNSPGHCCPLPMGFRNQFHKGSISNMTGSRLYGILYFFSNENMMQSCVYTLVRVTAALSATTPQVLGDVFGFFRGGVGNKEEGEGEKKGQKCNHTDDPSKNDKKYFCGWCASGLRDEVKKIEWIYNGTEAGGQYMKSVGTALIDIKGDKDTASGALKSGTTPTPSNLSALTDSNHYVSPLTGELYTAVSATFGGTYLSWVLYLSDALEGGLKSLASEFLQIECRGCRECDPNKCKKGHHGDQSDTGSALCNCSSIVSCTGVLPVLYRHGFGYGNPFNLEGYQQSGKDKGDYSIDNKGGKKHCHEFLQSLNAVIKQKQEASKNKDHPLTKLLSEVGKLQYDIRLPWIFVLTLAWLVAVLYLAFGAIWPLDWTHMRSHWLRGGEHQWQCMWYKVMTGRKGVELMEYFGRQRV